MSEPRRVPPPTAPLPQGGTASSAPASAVRVSSAQLFGGALELQIDHHGAVYRLKQTSLGKLILTK
ncbi:MAG: hemin uptake protein HemP [Burkholderiales bacterium]